MLKGEFFHIILLQDFFPKIGGAHLWLYEVYKRWPFPVTVLTQDYCKIAELSPKQNQFDSLDHGSIKILRRDLEIDDIDLFSPKYLKQLFKIRKLIQDISGKKRLLLHCLRAFPEGIGAMAFQIFSRHKCKFITYAHGEELLIARTSRQLQSLAKLVYKRSDLIIANSYSTKGLVEELCPKANVVVIHPGVDVDAFNIPVQQRIEYRKKWAWPDDTILLLTIARMEPRKNHAGVIKAIAELREEGLPLGYIIGGVGDEEANLRKIVKELGLNDWVKFLGRISEEQKKLCFASVDIHVMPSIRVGSMIEGFGIVFIEAAAAGIPSIAGNIGGQSEAVIHGRTGLVVDGANLKKLKLAIKYLAKNKHICEQMGLEAKTWAKKYDWDNVTRRTIFEIEEGHHG